MRSPMHWQVFVSHGDLYLLSEPLSDLLSKRKM